jgi:CHAT domain-containing protein
MARNGGDLLDRAHRALARVHDDPEGAVAEAVATRAEAEAAGDLVAASVAARAVGVALRDAGDLRGGAAALDAAVDLAERAGARREVGLARMSLVAVHLLAGHGDEARATGALAGADLDAVDAAALMTQLAVVDERAGRFSAAIDAYDRAEPVFVEHGDDVWLARLRTNRSVALAELGRLADAGADVDGAMHALGPSSGPLRAVLDLNRAWFAALAADVPVALGLYDAAAESARAARYPVGPVLRDRAELLTTVGLWPEAVATGTQAVESLDRTSPADAAEARLVLAMALAGHGDLEGAERAAAEAEASFTEQGRPVWAARAAVRRAAMTARHGTAAGDPPVAAVLGAGAVLRDAGLATEWLEARATAVQLAVAAGAAAPDEALPLVPPSGPPWVRARAWLAEAERRLAAGDRRGAARAAEAGLRPLETLRATLGSVELRAGLAATAAALADLLVEISSAGRPRQLLRAAERRAGQPVRADAEPDGPLARALVAMRAAAARTTTAGDAPETAAALRALAAAEAEVTRLARQALGRAAEERTAGDGAEVATALGADRVLARYIVTRGEVVAVVIDHRGARRFDLGPVEPVVAAADRLRAALARQARTRSERFAVAVRAAADELDATLVRPWRRRLEDRRVVVVPDGPLHSVAWASLPSFTARPVAASPSVSAWLAASRSQAEASRRATFVAGTGLDHGAAEINGAADAWRRAGGDATVLVDDGATVGRVLAAMDGCALAHLACHGHVRADAPAFSSLDLADGPLTGVELDLLPSAPSVVVLAACDVGTSSSVGNAEILGFPGWLLRAGSRNVIASTVPVPDEDGAAVFAAIAARLAEGVDPAEAVAAAAATDPTIAAGLVCVGAGTAAPGREDGELEPPPSGP